MQVLVLFHVLHSSAWYSPAHLLPFRQRMHERAAEGRAALGSQKTAKLASFERAVKVQGPYAIQLMACEQPHTVCPCKRKHRAVGRQTQHHLVA